MAAKTIAEVLAQQNPSLLCQWKGSSYENTKSNTKSYDSVLLDDRNMCIVKPWTDFTYEAIELAYGDLLNMELPNFKKPNTPSTTPVTITEESNIDSFCEIWNVELLRGPLKLAGRLIRQRLSDPSLSQAAGSDLANPTFAKARIQFQHPKQLRVKLTPDWAAYENTVRKQYKHDNPKQYEDKPDKFLVYSIGDSKLTEKWKSEWLSMTEAQAQKVKGAESFSKLVDGKPRPLQAMVDVREERILPLEQLAAYCRYAETRYFFLITQQELVAFRVRRISGRSLDLTDNPAFDKKKDRPFAAFEYKSIRWDAFGPKRLTVNLAIWALACMGMNDKHRAMEGPYNPNGPARPLAEMVRLTHWIKDQSNGGYRNVISGRFIGDSAWAGLNHSFVQLTHEGGYSRTESFYPRSVASITQATANLTLDQQQRRSRPNTPQPNVQPVQPSTTTPPPAPRPQRKGSTPADTPATPGSASKPEMGKRTTTIGKKKYDVLIKDKKPWKIVIDKTKNQMLAIKVDKAKGYYFEGKDNKPVYFQLDTK